MNWPDFMNPALELPGTPIPGRFGYRRVSEADYRAFPAVNASLLKAKTPAEMFQQLTTPQKQTDALTTGTLVHMATLEPETSWGERFALADIPINPKTGEPYGENTKKAAAAWEEARAENPGKIVVTESTLQEHITQCRNLQMALSVNPDAMGELADVDTEVSGIRWHPKWQCWVKWRLDILPKHCRYLVDVKTTSRHPSEFGKDCWQFGYYLQAAFYAHCHELLMSNMNLHVGKFTFIILAKPEEGRKARPPMARVADLPIDPSLSNGIRVAQATLGIPEGLSRVDVFMNCVREYVVAGEPTDFAGIRRCWPAYETESGENGRWVLRD